MDNYIELAVKQVGSSAAVAEALGVSRQAVDRWRKAGRLPRTDYTGETNYATKLSLLTRGAFSRDQLLRRLSAA